MGADVIKVELAPFGDRSRFQGIKPRAQKNSSQSTYFFQHNHSKRSLALQFKHPRTRELIKAMTAKIDVLVESFAPGVMARAGLAYEELSHINPRLIMCSISLAGQSGPLSQQPGYDYIAAAYAGVTDQIGEPDGDPAQLDDRNRRRVDGRCGGDGSGLRPAAPRADRRGAIHRQLTARHVLPHA